jgi:hypothetical protein
LATSWVSAFTRSNTKMKAVQRFFEEGDKVKVTLRFRGREMAHQDLGYGAGRAVSARRQDHDHLPAFELGLALDLGDFLGLGDKHDYDTKMKAVQRFFEEGDKVKVTLRFRGREMAHQGVVRAARSQRGARIMIICRPSSWGSLSTLATSWAPRRGLSRGDIVLPGEVPITGCRPAGPRTDRAP